MGFVGDAMKRIWKYILPIRDGVQEIDMPKGAIIRHIGDQPNFGHQIQIWAEVDDQETERFERKFQVFGTGHPIAPTEHFEEEFAYTGSVITAGGSLVWHVYERP
jgi:hypothetical protein